MLALLVLGWNEIMTIISNPIYLLLAVILGGGYFVIKSLGMEGTAMTVANQAFHQGKDMLLRELAKHAQAGAPAAGNAGGGGREKPKTE
jgi:hypothetical protein